MADVMGVAAACGATHLLGQFGWVQKQSAGQLLAMEADAGCCLLKAASWPCQGQ
jgi:hypothetical protein